MELAEFKNHSYRFVESGMGVKGKPGFSNQKKQATQGGLKAAMALIFLLSLFSRATNRFLAIVNKTGRPRDRVSQGIVCHTTVFRFVE